MWFHQIHLLFGSPSLVPAYSVLLSLTDFLPNIFLPSLTVSYVIRNFLEPYSLSHSTSSESLHTSYSLFLSPFPALDPLVLPL